MENLTGLSSLIRGLWKPLLAAVVALFAVLWIWNFFNQGTLKITITPAPAQLTIAGSTATTDQTTERGLAPGKYRLLIRKEGYMDYFATVTIESRKTTTLSVSLIKPPVKLSTTAKFPAFTATGAVNYLAGDSRIHRVSLTGTDAAISDLAIPDTLNFLWSPDGGKVILTVYNRKTQLQQAGSPFLSSGDENLAAITWAYDLSTKKLSRLGADLGGFGWGGDSRTVYYAQGKSIYKVNSDGSAAQKITEASAFNLMLRPSPDGRRLIWYQDPEGFGRNYLYLQPLPTGTQKQLTTDGYTYGANWSPDGGTILTNSVDPAKFTTSLSTIIPEGTRKELGVAGNAEEAAWGPGSNLVYFVNAAERKIVSLKVSDSSISELATFVTGLPSDLVVSPDGDYLSYIYQGSLYLLKIR